MSSLSPALPPSPLSLSLSLSLSSVLTWRVAIICYFALSRTYSNSFEQSFSSHSSDRLSALYYKPQVDEAFREMISLQKKQTASRQVSTRLS